MSCLKFFPEELLECVLLELDGLQFLRASRVCMRWCQAVRRSRRLGYRINLALEGVVEDAVDVTTTLEDRALALRTYALLWNRLLLVRPREVVIDIEDDDLELHVDDRGGVRSFGEWIVCWDVDTDRPSHIARLGGSERLWRELCVPGANGWCRNGFMIGLEALDLLVLVSERPGAPQIQLLDADNLARHSHAHSEVLPWPGVDTGTPTPKWVTPGLCCDILSLNFMVDGNFALFVWDWHLGAFIFRYTRPSPSSLGRYLTNSVLLSDRAFAWVEMARSVHGLVDFFVVVRIFDRDGNVSGGRRWAFPSVAFDFRMKAVLRIQDLAEVDVELRTNRRMFADSSRGPDGHLSEKLVALQVTVSGNHRTFYCLRSTFLRPVAAGMNADSVVAWKDWGPSQTRCIPGCVWSIRGCRAIHRSPELDGVWPRQVLCFLPERCRAAQCGVFASGCTVSQFVDGPATVKSCDFADTFTTSLPYFDAPSYDPTGEVKTVPRNHSFWPEIDHVTWADDRDPNKLHVLEL